MKVKDLGCALKHVQSKFPNLPKNDLYSIVENLTKYSYSDLILNASSRVSPLFLLKFKIIERKLNKKIPLPYILRNKVFYGNNIFVTSDVLIPRPETEMIVDYANEFLRNRSNIKAIDLCAGSGCIGVSILKNNFDKIDSFTFSDISYKALKICKKNISRFNLSAKCNIVNGDFIKPFLNNTKFDLIVCNPPYIDFKDTNVNFLTYKFEPSNALFAKEKGLYFYKELFSNLQNLVDFKKDFMIILEIGWEQKHELEKMLKRVRNIKYQFFKDYSNNWRNIIIEKTGD